MRSGPVRTAADVKRLSVPDPEDKLRYVMDAVRLIRRELDGQVPLIGCGGIANATDAIEFLMAGATAVQVGTATFTNPLAPIEILEGIERFCREQGLADVREIIGAARHAP